MRNFATKFTAAGRTLTLEDAGEIWCGSAAWGWGMVVVTRRAGKGREGKVGGRRYRGKQSEPQWTAFYRRSLG
jgi:hypothetical protein